VKRRKVLFLTVIPSPYQRETFQALATTTGWDVRVLYYAASASDRSWAKPVLTPIERVLPGLTLSPLGRSAHLNPGILSEVNRHEADLTVVSDYSAPSAQLAMRYLALRGRRWAFWGEAPGFNRRGSIGRSARRLLQAPLGRASGIIGIGSHACEIYRRLFPRSLVVDVPYFCDLDPYRKAAEKACRERQPTVETTILFSGQIIPRKGVDVLLQAFERMLSAGTAARLLIAGSGSELSSYEASVPERWKDRVHFLGHVPPEELPTLFAQADVYCLPSRYDGWGVVINEALGAGLPVVASTAVGAARDLVVDGENGFVVPPGDADALAHALLRLCLDASFRSRCAQASRRLSYQWDLAAAVRRWSAALEAIAGEP
jgi:glycosyltransferase involved in cell wall biosynthesis